MGEIRLAIRSLLKTKLFTAVATLTLMIGIGATTAVFSVYDAVALRALPFADPKSLVDVEEWSATELCGGCGVGVSRPMFDDIQKRATSFQGLAAYSEIPVNVGGLDVPERVSSAEVSGNFFNVLGLRPVMGRTLDLNDDRVGAPPVVVVSSRYFASRLGSDPTKIGQTIRINGQPATIVGVMPTTAVLPEFAQLWLPMSRTPAGTDRSARDLGVIGRLKPGVSHKTADAELASIATDMARAYPETQKNWTARARELRRAIGDDDVPIYGLMFASVVVLWAIVCANLAGLLVARAIGRRREVAVRLALGANRGDIVWHLFAESVCLAIVGGVLGAVASSWAIELLLASLDKAIPSWLTPKLDWTVLGFCLLLSALSATAAGLLPAWRASRPNVHDDLKAGAQTSVGSSKSTLRGSLVVLQLALSLVLIAVAGVLTATITSVAGRGGEQATDIVQARVALLGETSTERVRGSIDAFVKRLGALPEARSAAASGTGFIAGFGGRDRQISVEGMPTLPDGASPRFYLAVTPRYFETTGMRLIEGRAFQETDRPGSAPVVIIGQRLATQLWKGATAVGHRIRLGGDSLPWRTVVGVLAEKGDTSGRSSNMAYVPFAQSPTTEATLIVASKGSASAIVNTVRDAAKSVEPDLPLLDLMTSVDAHRQVWRPYKAFALTISTIGGIALVLSAIGLYGVIAYGAQQRTREIGLRIALGARPGDVVRLITGQGFRLVTGGVVLGLIAAVAAMPLMKGMMFGLDPLNPTVFALSALVLVAVAGIASYLPARRAAATDPMVALRND
jgi:putative ABC transport system permease protein